MDQTQVLYFFMLLEFAALYFLERVQSARVQNWVHQKADEQAAEGKTTVSIDAAEFGEMSTTKVIKAIKALLEVATFATVGLCAGALITQLL